MGIDINSNSGFTLPYNAFLQLIKPAHIRGIKVHAVQLFLRRLEVKYSKRGKPVVLDDAIETALSQILGANDPAEMVAALTDSLKTDGDWIFEKSDSDSQAFCLIQCICRVLLPLEPKEIRIFTNPREEDCYGQELNVPTLIFSSADCFEVVMSPKGRTMAQTLGKSQIEMSTWTDFSY